jgi:hypothetical protein
MISRKQIEARIAILQAEMVTIKAAHDAHAGALQDCEFWLTQIDRGSDKVDEPQESSAESEEP